MVLLHYAPIMDTVMGEPEQIFPFLGNDRLLEPIDRFKARRWCSTATRTTAPSAGKTPGGVPVFNVSMVRVKEDAGAELFYVHEIPIPTDGAGQEHEPEPDVETPADSGAGGGAGGKCVSAEVREWMTSEGGLPGAGAALDFVPTCRGTA